MIEIRVQMVYTLGGLVQNVALFQSRMVLHPGKMDIALDKNFGRA